MNRKVLGWNINQRSGLGKEIPEFVLQELLEQDADVIVLTEVVTYVVDFFALQHNQRFLRRN